MAPDLRPEPGWVRTEPLANLPSRRNFVADDPTGERIRIAYFVVPAQPNHLFAKVWFGPAAEGPPAHAHGGAIMAVLDEVLGGCIWVAGRPVVLARFEVDCRRCIPLGSVVTVAARIHAAEGRKVWAKGDVLGDDGGVFASATGLFIELSGDRLAQLAGARHPSAG